MTSLAEHQFRSKTAFISESLRDDLRQFNFLLNSGKPRILTLLGEKKPIMVFTDGACEGANHEVVTIGALLYDTLDSTKEMFGTCVPSRVVQLWQGEFPGKEQTISQAETLPLLLARVIWGGRIAARRVYFCLDNNGVRFALLKGTSNSLANRQLVRRFFEIEIENPSFYWLLRVPSACNPADGPSRLLLEPSPDNLHAKKIAPPSPEFIEAICGLAR
jgi:hypothetical protein